ncbi:MAG: transcriptional repressor LexA [Gammaproteobacteria bacterium]|nr:transcriptional repressor LexA [Gammaproteobacteria bacterium]
MLSKREQDAYAFIRDYIAQHEQGPLLDEIAQGLGIRSRGVAHRYVQSLAQKELIELVPGRHRGIQLLHIEKDNETTTTRHNPSATTLPLLGNIAAGLPIEAIPHQEEIDLTEFFMGSNRFVLKVQGESMIEAGIMPGDMVIVESRNHAHNGEIVVALIEGEDATLKRLKNNGNGSVTLIPENSSMQPMIFAADQVQIQGVVVGQMRSYR